MSPILGNVTIAADRGKAAAYTAGQFSVARSSKYMYPSIRGETIRINDMVAVTHKVTVNKHNKNLFNGNLLAQTQTVNGITVDNKGDNTFHFHGTATTTFTTSFMVTTLGVRIDPTKIYTIHAKLIAGAMNGITAIHPFIGIWDTLNGSVNYSNCTVNSSLAVGDTASTAWPNTVNAIKADAQYISRFWLFADGIQQGAKIDFTIQVWINESSTNLGYTPYIENLDAVKVYKYGKNLFDKSYLKNGVTYNALQGTVADDGNTITFKPNASTLSSRVQLLLPAEWFKEGVTYTLGFNCSMVASIVAVGTTNNFNDTASYNKFGRTIGANYHAFTINGLDKPYVNVYIYAQNQPEGTIVTINDIQISIGNTLLPYEPYKEPVEIGETFDSTTDTITLMPDTSGVVLDCQYIRDIDRYIDDLNVAEVV